MEVNLQELEIGSIFHVKMEIGGGRLLMLTEINI